MDSDGRLVFDVNDFDEAYIGHFSWDLQRFAASLALMGWRKALPEQDVRRARRSLRARLPRPGQPLPRTRRTTPTSRSTSTRPTARSTTLLQQARMRSRVALLDVDDRPSSTGVRHVPRGRHRAAAGKAERREVERAFEGYLDTIPEDEEVRPGALLRRPRPGREDRVRDRQRRAPGVQRARRGLQPGARQRRRALDEAGQRAGSEPVRRPQPRSRATSSNEAHRTVVSQRALQAHTDPLLGWTHRRRRRVRRLRGLAVRGRPRLGLRQRARRRSASVVDQLGRATAKIHCASDEDSDQTLVDVPGGGGGRRVPRGPAQGVHRGDDRVRARATPQTVRQDHALFVEAFREGRIGVDAT